MLASTSIAAKTRSSHPKRHKARLNLHFLAPGSKGMEESDSGSAHRKLPNKSILHSLHFFLGNENNDNNDNDNNDNDNNNNNNDNEDSDKAYTPTNLF